MAEQPLAFDPMTDDDFDAYIEAAVVRYAGDIARATGWANDEALTKARAQIAGLLSAGRSTPGHHFQHVLDNEGRAAGGLWYAERRDEEPARLFLYDIHLLPAARGRGLGTRVMRLLEGEAGRLGLPALGLSVFRHNTGAVRLYERLGFEVEASDEHGLAMGKPLAGK